jgi:hypothetical protein
MPFRKGQSGNPRGRKHGTPNKVTHAAKSAIEVAAEGLGGSQRLIAWAKESPANERIFWGQIYTKLLPLQVTGDEGRPLIPPGGVTFVIREQADSDNRT